MLADPTNRRVVADHQRGRLPKGPGRHLVVSSSTTGWPGRSWRLLVLDGPGVQRRGRRRPGGLRDRLLPPEAPHDVRHRARRQDDAAAAGGLPGHDTAGQAAAVSAPSSQMDGATLTRRSSTRPREPVTGSEGQRPAALRSAWGPGPAGCRRGPWPGGDDDPVGRVVPRRAPGRHRGAGARRRSPRRAVGCARTSRRAAGQAGPAHRLGELPGSWRRCHARGGGRGGAPGDERSRVVGRAVEPGVAAGRGPVGGGEGGSSCRPAAGVTRRS